MNGIAVPHAPVKTSIVLLAAAILLVALLGTAGAASPVGRDGKIHACYRVKGKPKGGLRVVPSAKARCRRGERKVAWSAVGLAGQAGDNGQSGGGGQSGPAGANGSAGGSEAALQSKVANLTLKMEGVEGVLQGVSHGDLTGALSTLDGVTNADLTDTIESVEGLTNADLTEAVESLPVLESVCDQTSELIAQLNLLQGAVEGLGLNGVLEALGGVLEIPTLPVALPPFDCEAP